ncbi:hypothetical protein GQ44DRAFT_698472 [Phaeosphaeriaceae sp. PMI808]|nr:hypothetical protein GQ44DRAFT_698472 [Phaeosphaeriaceae sp. PMI808]
MTTLPVAHQRCTPSIAIDGRDLMIIPFPGTHDNDVWIQPYLEHAGSQPFRATPEDAILLVKDWLKSCDQQHLTCPLRVDQGFSSRLIEIVDLGKGILRLIKGSTSNEKYTTLSYRWGNPMCNEDWIKEGGQMDKIYLTSYLTISADDGADADSGFLCQRNMLGWQPCPTKISLLQ